MDDLIDYVKIDAKHSNEDVIMPIGEIKAKWGNRIAILGGVDVNYLCTHSTSEIAEYTKRVLDECAEGGGFAIGTGNTVANYIPVDNYLALVETVHRFNG